MRSNNQSIRQIEKTVSSISKTARKAKSMVSLGLEGKQWLACALICGMLLPIFSLPVTASVRYSNSGNTNEFEPVNEDLPIWTEVWRNLNAKAEAWTTPKRAENVFYNGGEDDKKNKKKAEKQDAQNGEAEPQTSADKNTVKESVPENQPTTNVIADAAEKTGIATETIKSEKETPESKPENISAPNLKNKPSAVSPPMSVNQLPNDERGSVYNYENNLGAPPGQVEADSSNEAAAISVRHRAGIANFSFGVPLAGLSARGMDAGIGMTYNSRAWNKSCSQYDTQGNCLQNHFTYDVEQSWVAPGFSTGLGYLQSNLVTRNVVMMNGSNTVVKTLTEIIPEGIIDPDGTRRQINCKASAQILGGHSSASYCTDFETSDGSLIKVTRNGIFFKIDGMIDYAATSFTVNSSNGSMVSYSNGFGSGTTRRHYPLSVRDRNGNIMRIAYRGQTGRIDYITDTLGRKIKFYYETDVYGNPEEPVAVTIPGMAADSEIQTVRFYYEDMPLNAASGFNGQITAPANVKVLKYVYMPATKTGYKYDYHPKYGMIKKISRMVGLNASTTETDTTGTIDGGIVAASTEYLYPDGNTALDDVPKYNSRLDDWAGRTGTSPQQTIYEEPEYNTQNLEMTSTITVKDDGFDVVTENIAHFTGDWKNGLVKKTRIIRKAGSLETQMAATGYFWKRDVSIGGRGNPVMEKIEVTNEANLTKASKFFYDGYNNQTKTEEYDYAAMGTLGTLLRTTDIEYETGADWIGKRLFSLPKSVKSIVGGQTVAKTLYEYDHNGSDAELIGYADMNSSTHDSSFNKANPPHTCRRMCGEIPVGATIEPEENLEQCPMVCTGSYRSSTRFRGNLTKVTSFSDATLASDPNADVKTLNYDIAGNVVSVSLSCCNIKLINYGNTFAETGYAFPISETKGSSPQLTNSVTYNYGTGLPLTSTNESGQITNYEYEPDTLRQKKTIYPNGGYTETAYSDKLVTDTANLLPGFVRTTTTLDANNTVRSYGYYDGRGLGIRSATETTDGWSVAAMEYDKLGRPRKSYNPFYAATPTAEVPADTKYTEVVGYDAFGRTTAIRLQDNTTVQTEFGDAATTPANFNKTFVIATDQAGKKRRQIADALGRIVRVDEPDASGNLGSLTTPAQPTVYEYDANDNLAKVIQTDGAVVQERLFKYDSLSRLTHEKQVEATATLDNNGVKQTSGGLWTKVLKYNIDGLLAEGIDARGVKTTFAYDGLNRVQSVSYTGETGLTTPNVTYTYDQARSGHFNTGALTRVETAATATAMATATEFDYDAMGRAVKHRQAIGTQIYPMEYGYNLAGQLTSQKYPSGKVVSIGYDTKGRLAQIADQTRTYLNGLQYQGKGNSLNQMSFGNGTTQSFAMNDRLQMTNQTLSRGSEVLQKYDYGYGQIDSNGNLDLTKNNGQLAKVESHIGANKQWTQKFDYDSLGRLSESKEYRGDTNALSYKQKFDYDKFGNLYRKNASNPTGGQETPLGFKNIEETDINKATNRFTTETIYDDAGNVIVDSKFRTSNFSYDANGRMVKATRANVPDATSIYDASGMRVAEKVNDVWRFLIYDIGGKLIAEYGGLQATDEGGVKYLCTDWQGSTRAIVSNSGFVQSRMDYTAFGEDIQSGTGIRTTAQGFNSNNNLRQKYGLTERDEATGLDHTWFRKNEQKAGRWTSPDPYNGSMSLGNPQSFNRYSYVENQPTNYVDPSGLNAVSFFCYDIVTTGHYTNDPSHVYTNTRTVCSSFGGGGSSGNSTTGGIEVGGGGGNSTDEPSINQNVLNDCIKSLFGKGVAELFKFEEATKAKNGFLSINPFTSNGTFDINVTSFNDENYDEALSDIRLNKRLSGDIGGAGSLFTLGLYSIGQRGTVETGSVGTIYLSNQTESSALPILQIGSINQLLIQYTGIENLGLFRCVSENKGIKE